VVEDAPVKTFKSVNDLVWWLQNNGGGKVEIDVSEFLMDDAVKMTLTLKNADAVTGAGPYLRSALAEVAKNV
jgi:hypothetical protein